MSGQLSRRPKWCHASNYACKTSEKQAFIQVWTVDGTKAGARITTDP